MTDRPLRVRDFLEALSALSRLHGVVIVAGDLEFKDEPKGMYCLNPNAGPGFGWREAVNQSATTGSDPVVAAGDS